MLHLQKSLTDHLFYLLSISYFVQKTDSYKFEKIVIINL